MLPKHAYAAGLWSYCPYSEALSQEVRCALPKALASMLDLPRFHTALGKLLGIYRYYVTHDNSQPSAAIVIAQVEAVHEALHQAVQHLYHLPPLAKVLLQQQSPEETRYATHIDSVFARTADLLQIQEDLARVHHRLLKEFEPKKGRPSEYLRDALLTDTCDLARAYAITDMTLEQAGEIAHSILLAAEIPTPADLHQILRIARKVRRERAAAECCGTSTEPVGKGPSQV